MQPINAIFYVAILIMSVVVHEVAHGYAALRQGDQTAKVAGRLTLNPIKHLDIFGSVILPLLLVLTKAGFVLGWARPVPYNPNNLRDKKWGTLLVASAGIIANLVVALFFGLVIRLASSWGFQSIPFLSITTSIVLVNVLLAVFNIIPIPTLDGSKILFSVLPYRFRDVELFIERYSLFFILFLIFFLWKYISPVVIFIFSLFTGLTL